MLNQPATPIRFSPRAKFVTVLAVVVLGVMLLNSVTHILMPFIWALIIAYILNPIVGFLTRRTRTPRFWWVLMIYIVGFGLFGLLGSKLAPLAAKQYQELNASLPVWKTEVEAYVREHPTIGIFGFEVNIADAEDALLSGLNKIPAELPAFVPSVLFGVVETFILILVFFIVTFYLLLQAEQISENFYGLIPAHHRDEIRQLVGSIDNVLGAYVRGQFVLIAIMSVLSYIALTILGIKYALVIAIATGVLEIIPFVGPYAATALAAIVALLQGTTPFNWEPWFLCVVVIITYFSLRMIEDHFIIPNVVGHMVNLHPILVLFALLAGGTLAGAMGLLLAIPIAAAIKIVLAYLYSKLMDSPTPRGDVKSEERDLLEPKQDKEKEKDKEPAPRGTPEAA
ncbi:MAG TPA: AI-2E family transporter [Herpetosiphonaceae bacterium]